MLVLADPPPVTDTTPEAWLEKVLWRIEKMQVDWRSQTSCKAAGPGPALLSNDVLVTATVQVVGLAPAEQFTATGGAGTELLLESPLLVKELLVMLRLPENDWVASMQDAAWRRGEGGTGHMVSVRL